MKCLRIYTRFCDRPHVKVVLAIAARALGPSLLFYGILANYKDCHDFPRLASIAGREAVAERDSVDSGPLTKRLKCPRPLTHTLSMYRCNKRRERASETITSSAFLSQLNLTLEKVLAHLPVQLSLTRTRAPAIPGQCRAPLPWSTSLAR